MTPEEKAKHEAHLRKLLKNAQTHPASTSRRWGLAALTSTYTLRVEGWFTTQKNARLLANFVGIRNPVICRWHDAGELKGR